MLLNDRNYPFNLRTERIAVMVGFFFLVNLCFLSTAAAKRPKSAPIKPKPTVSVSVDQILDQSQVSYLADGGFTGVRSFGVIVSCVNGKISVLKTLIDPTHYSHPIHQRGSMSQQAYLRLWSDLQKQNVFQTETIPTPLLEINDEFTIEFKAQVGKVANTFEVYGIRRPEASHHYAIKTLIDQSVKMQAFLSHPPTIAQK